MSRTTFTRRVFDSIQFPLNLSFEANTRQEDLL